MNKSNVYVTAEELRWEGVGAGVERKILGYDPALMMVCVKFLKGSVGSVHKHPHRQVTFVGKGSFEVQIGSQKKVLQAGDSFFVPPDVEHGVVALEDGTLVDVFTPGREDFLTGK
jgi:quercetin dioxygenase-like cupin family protein